MKFHAVLFFAAAAVFSACSDDGGESEGDVRLASGTPKNYTVYADDTSCTPSEGISFTTTGPWRASVEETRAEMSGSGSVSWVNISPDHGDAAGDYTISIQLDVNATGRDRRATVTIECGSTKITIVVEQRGKTEDGEVPDAPGPSASKFVSRIDETISYWEGCEDRFNTETYVFKYDDRNRVVELTVTLGKDDETAFQRVCRLDYSTANRIRIDTSCDPSAGGTASCYIAVLDGSGRVSRIENTTSQDDFRCDFTYNAEGRLARQDWSVYDRRGYRTFDYKDGVLSGRTISGEEEYTDGSEEGLEKLFGGVKNDMLNIDPNMIFMGGLLYDTQYDGYDVLNTLDCLALLRLTGRGSDRCLERYDGDDAVEGVMAVGYPEPNAVVHRSSEYCEYDLNESLRYTLNDDGSVSSISQEELCKKIHYEYDIVSSDESFDPRRPELGYKFRIANQTWNTLGTGKNLYTRKFSYR